MTIPPYDPKSDNFRYYKTLDEIQQQLCLMELENPSVHDYHKSIIGRIKDHFYFKRRAESKEVSGLTGPMQDLFEFMFCLNTGRVKEEIINGEPALVMDNRDSCVREYVKNIE